MGFSGRILTSGDGIIWTIRTSGTENTLLSIIYANNKYVTVGTAGTILSSETRQPVSFERYEFYQTVNPSLMNPNNFIIPGLPIRLKIMTRNYLSQNLLTLKGIIRSSNSNVTIMDSIGNFNNILSNQAGWSSDEFEVLLKDNIPANTTASFDLIITDELVIGGPWVSSFTIPLTPFIIPRVLIDDDNNPDSRGNNNDIIEPNEIGELIPIISNMSGDSFYNVYGRLFSSTPNISIWNNRQGSTEMVYDSSRYNVTFGNQIKITPLQANIVPEVDYVFSYNNQVTYLTRFTLAVTGYLNEVPGVSWDVNGIKHKWGIPFVLNSGYPDTIRVEDVPDISLIELSVTVSPNPANPTVNLSIGIPFAFKQGVSVQIVGINGKAIKTWQLSGIGYHNFTWDARDRQNRCLSSGMYMLRVIGGTKILQKKLMLLK